MKLERIRKQVPMTWQQWEHIFKAVSFSRPKELWTPEMTKYVIEMDELQQRIQNNTEADRLMREYLESR